MAAGAKADSNVSMACSWPSSAGGCSSLYLWPASQPAQWTYPGQLKASSNEEKANLGGAHPAWRASLRTKPLYKQVLAKAMSVAAKLEENS